MDAPPTPAETPPPPDGLYDIVVLQPEPPLWPLLASLLFALLLAAGTVWLIVWLLRRPARTGPAVPPAVRAAGELERLERLHDELPPNRFALSLSEILKNYLDERFGDRVRYETAEEFLARLARTGSSLPSAAQQELRDFLLAAEGVKFGHSPEAAAATRSLLKRARSLLSLCESVNAPGGPASDAPAPR